MLDQTIDSSCAHVAISLCCVSIAYAKHCIGGHDHVILWCIKWWSSPGRMCWAHSAFSNMVLFSCLVLIIYMILISCSVPVNHMVLISYLVLIGYMVLIICMVLLIFLVLTSYMVLFLAPQYLLFGHFAICVINCRPEPLAVVWARGVILPYVILSYRLCINSIPSSLLSLVCRVRFALAHCDQSLIQWYGIPQCMDRVSYY